MKRMIKLLSIILVTTIIILSIPVTASSYDIYTYYSFKSFGGVRLLQNQNEVFLIGGNGNNIYIECVYPESYCIELNLENDVYTFNLFDSTLVMVCPNENTEQTQIILYDIYSDTFTDFSISSLDYPESSQIGYDNSCIYISNDKGCVKKYSLYGKTLNTYNISDIPAYLSVNTLGNVYAYTSNGFYELYPDGSKLVSTQTLDAPIKLINQNVFIDDTGYYYKIDSSNLRQLITSKNTVYYPSGYIIDNHALVTEHNILYGVDLTNNKADRYISFYNYIEEFCCIDSTILALSYKNGLPTVSKAKYSDMIKLNNNSNGNNNSNNSNNSNVNNSDVEINYTNIPYSITSEVYKIDDERQTITNISHSTTIAEFKKNINYDGFDLNFTRYDGKVIKSGNVGTATIVRFYNDDYFIEYELAVMGDLTGEGNVNTRDKKLMFYHLLDEVIFSGVFIDSADLDHSNRIDTIDLVLLLRLIADQKK